MDRRGYSGSIKLTSPNVLPEQGLTSAKFKPWKLWVFNFLDQDMDNEQFLTGGRYATWTAATASPRGAKGRISTLFAHVEGTSPSHHRDDTITEDDVKAEINKRDPTVVEGATAYDRKDAPAIARKKAEMEMDLLGVRNRQLTKMIQLVCSFVNYTEAPHIYEDSTSLEWIWEYLQRHYNIQSKGVNFLKLAQITYKSGENPQTFYKQFRTAMVDNLRKAGDAKNHLIPGSKLEVDEVISPTMDDAMVLWVLEKIDPRLPPWVAREYEGRLDKDTHLIDLQAVIFQRVPAMLEAIEREAGLAALTFASASAPVEGLPAAQCSPSCSAFSSFRGRGGRGRPSPRGRGSGGAPGGVDISPTTGLPKTPKFCMICFKQGKPPNPKVYTSHNTVSCNALSTSDRREMLAALQAMNLTDDFGPVDEGEEVEEGTEGQEYAQGLQDYS